MPRDRARPARTPPRGSREARGGRIGRLAQSCALLVALAWTVRTASAETLVLEAADARVSFDQQTAQPIVAFRLTEPSRRMFGEFTARNVGRTVEIRVDGRVVVKPVVRVPIVDGVGQLSGGFSLDGAKQLAGRLSSGSAKLEVEAVP
jgi:preprotein translocase subunit SecD